MSTATREAALAPTATRYCTVFIPEQGLTYRLRSITEAERQFYRRILCGDDTPERNQLALVAFTAVDDAGQRLFRDEDVDLLGQLDSAVTTRLYQAALEHCTFESEGDLGNSPRIPTGCSR